MDCVARGHAGPTGAWRKLGNGKTKTSKDQFEGGRGPPDQSPLLRPWGGPIALLSVTPMGGSLTFLSVTIFHNFSQFFLTFKMGFRFFRCQNQIQRTKIIHKSVVKNDFRGFGVISL